MIYHNNKEVGAVWHKKRIVSTIFHAAKLVWQAIRSCFGSGVWDNTKPWSNEEGWKNNK